MAIILLPDAQSDLLTLQEYMLDKWGESLWLKAEDEIFDKLAKLDTGAIKGTVIHELASLGIMDYQHIYTSHHKLVYRRIGKDTYVYLVAGHRQDFPTLLVKRLLSR